ncbi:hypothetical protein AcV7_001193 [Taiwanofungus camphoratus]|nr:hypothetical protein AcV7_001193 [Antrodia cinnamomea]
MAKSTVYGDTSFPQKRGSISSSASSSFTSSSPLEFKRTRRSPSSPSTPTMIPGHRRRVNPESLAVRLGPQLIKELEALLEPGMSEMPPFAVRQEIQQRYNINRRHIYDWFHSKGLRVTREEKRVSLEERGRGVRVQRKIRQCPAPDSTPAVPPPSPSANLTDSNESSLALPLTSQNLVHSFKTISAFSQAKQHSSSKFYSIGSVSVLYPEENNLSTNLVTPTSADSLGNNVILPAAVVDLSASSCPDRLNEYIIRQESILPTSDILISTPAYMTHMYYNETLFSLHGQDSLSPSQRQAFYESLSDALGPAYGIQESVGTYKSYMLKQKQMYYERLLLYDTVCAATKAYSAGSSIVSSSVGHNRPSMYIAHSAAEVPSLHQRHSQQTVSPKMQNVSDKDNTSEFSSWLLYGGRSQPESLVSSPAHTPDLSSDTGTDISQIWTTDDLDDSSESGAMLDIGDILESPVLRSRNPSSASEQLPFGDSVSGEHQEFSSGKPQVVSPEFGHQVPSATGVPIERPVLLRHAYSWEEPQRNPYAHFSAAFVSRWENSDFALTLQNAKATRGLEKMVQGKARARGRLCRTRTNSAGGGM